jgi:hypothetical protein
VFVSILTNQLSGEDTTDFTDRRFRLFEKIFQLATGKKLDKEIAVDESLLAEYVGNIFSNVQKKSNAYYLQEGWKVIHVHF